MKQLDTVVLERLGLNQNQIKIYISLLGAEFLSVGQIAQKSGVHRRNVYDCIEKLVDLDLVEQSQDMSYKRYKAAPPKTLKELVVPIRTRLQKDIAKLKYSYVSQQTTDSIYIYSGLEGWKNYIRDILEIGQTDYIIGAKGVWADPQIYSFVQEMIPRLEKKNIRFKILVNRESADAFSSRSTPLAQILKAEVKFLPSTASALSGVEVYGDRVVILADDSGGVLRSDLQLIVIRNQDTADFFRTWHELLWNYVATTHVSNR